ncbi:MAG: hypothetical protein ISR76_07625 [Planctomycetes bacterium]|nr:hypothetical protein [Planctomycetota bacterium]MBL7008853.1 hypothetical protein [Planctomycetota bacterium]
MTASVADAWTEKQAPLTLRRLRADYPGYTDNELYAIWCVVHGKVPLDTNGKVILEQWKIHGEEDGSFLDQGPFKVSRALFGRAQKAQKGLPKPKRKVRAPKAPTAARPAAGAPGGPGLSPRALEFAQAYDHAAKLIDGIILHRHEIDELRAELCEVKDSILEELAAASPETQQLLKEVGALK